MKSVGLIALLPLLGGCGIADQSARFDIHAIQRCAELHPAPPEANVQAVGLIPVYLTRSAASDDAAVQQWYGEMDACTKQDKSVSGEKPK
jgi:hypothetical protein